MRRIFVTTAVVLMAGMAVSSVAQAAPNRIKIASKDGKARIKVKKKTPLLFSCSNPCSGTVTATLVTPASSNSDSKNVNFKAGFINRVNYRLSGFGVRYIKRNISRSKLKVKFSAVDLDTGKRRVKRRTFRFHK